jgi:hypothetical protein
MMKKTQGFVTEDGTFFESEQEAMLHEAEMKLRGVLSGVYPHIVQDTFFEVIFGVMPELKEYMNAYNAPSTAKRNQPPEKQDGAEVEHSREAQADGGIGHVSSTEKDLEALLKLPARGSVHVPDMGRGSRTKKVSERREKHGP